MVAGPLSVCLLVGGCSSAGSDSSPADTTASTVPSTVHPDDALFQTRFLACLTEAGIPAELTDDGGVHMIPPPGQEVAAQAVAQRCSEELGYSGMPPPLDGATLRALYERYLEAVECLRANGYSPAQPVSEDVYIERQVVPPYEGIDLTTVDAGEMLRLCPEPRP